MSQQEVEKNLKDQEITDLGNCLTAIRNLKESLNSFITGYSFLQVTVDDTIKFMGSTGGVNEGDRNSLLMKIQQIQAKFNAIVGWQITETEVSRS